MSGVPNARTGIDSMNRLKAAIKDLPIRIRSAVAQDAAGVLNNEMRSAFNSGRTVYDTPRPLSVNGAPLTLVKTGATRSALFFVVIGTILRAQLGTKYGKYLVGKYGVMPQSLPAAWRAKLTQIVDEYRADFEREYGRAT